jgi:hypothetical protein
MWLNRAKRSISRLGRFLRGVSRETSRSSGNTEVTSHAIALASEVVGQTRARPDQYVDPVRRKLTSLTPSARQWADLGSTQISRDHRSNHVGGTAGSYSSLPCGDSLNLPIKGLCSARSVFFRWDDRRQHRLKSVRSSEFQFKSFRNDF